MYNIEFTLKDKELLLKHQEKLFFYYSKQHKESINSLAFYYCYGEELVGENLLTAYLENSSLPLVWFSSYDHHLISHLQNQNIPHSSYIDLCKNTNDEPVIFKESIDDTIKNNIILNAHNNGLTVISSSNYMGRYCLDIENTYLALFLNYLHSLENISTLIPKTIFVVKFEYDTLPLDTLNEIHHTIKKIKEAGHIVIFMFHCYGDISNIELNLFDNNLYENYIVSTMGSDNKVLTNLPNTKIYSHLPQLLKNFLSDPQLENYNKYHNYYHSEYNISIINTFEPIKIL